RNRFSSWGGSSGSGSPSATSDSNQKSQKPTKRLANEKIQTARDAEAAAKELLDQVNKDGKVTAEEQQQLKDAQAEVQKAKDEAQQIINNLPKRQRPQAQKELDNVKGIEVPEVTKDDNSNNNNNNQ